MEYQRHKIYHAFMFVPQAVIKRLNGIAQKRLDRAMNPTDDNQALGDGEDADDVRFTKHAHVPCIRSLCAIIVRRTPLLTLQ